MEGIRQRLKIKDLPSHYYLARDIVDYARSQGYNPPMSDGRVHPGTLCNQALRVIMRDAGMRRKFSLNPTSAITVPFYNLENSEFSRFLLDSNIECSHPTLSKGYLDLYSERCVEALLFYFCNAEKEVKSAITYAVPCSIVIESKSIDKKQMKPKASLFRR